MDQPGQVEVVALVKVPAPCGCVDPRLVCHPGARRLPGCFQDSWILLFSGCSTYTDRVTEIRSAFYAQDLKSAEQLIAEGLKRTNGNEDVLKLERAMTELADGEPWKAEQTLREVRDRFDYLEQADVGEATLAYLTDDQRRSYAGEDYEKVLLRAFLALSNLLHDGADAGAYSLQMMEKQEQIIASAEAEDGTNPKRDYPRVALAPYLQGMLQEVDASGL